MTELFQIAELNDMNTRVLQESYQYKVLFSIKPDDLGRTKITQHRIGTRNIKQHPRRLLFVKQEDVDKCLQYKGVID